MASKTIQCGFESHPGHHVISQDIEDTPDRHWVQVSVFLALLLSSWLPREGGEQQFARGLSHSWPGAVTKDLLRARDDMRVCVDLLGRADHPHDLPEGAKGGWVE